MDLNRNIKKEAYEYKKMVSNDATVEDSLKNNTNMRSEYNMFGLIFQQIAVLRTKTSDAGIMVRLNNKDSPDYVDVYHTLIYSFLEQVSVIIPDHLWKKIFKMWCEVKEDIITYQIKRRVTVNLKIPNLLIQKLDKLHRIALLAAQRANLGISLVNDLDINKAIEDSIVGN